MNKRQAKKVNKKYTVYPLIIDESGMYFNARRENLVSGICIGKVGKGKSFNQFLYENESLIAIGIVMCASIFI